MDKKPEYISGRGTVEGYDNRKDIRTQSETVRIRFSSVAGRLQKEMDTIRTCVVDDLSTRIGYKTAPKLIVALTRLGEDAEAFSKWLEATAIEICCRSIEQCSEASADSFRADVLERLHTYRARYRAIRFRIDILKRDYLELIREREQQSLVYSGRMTRLADIAKRDPRVATWIERAVVRWKAGGVPDDARVADMESVYWTFVVEDAIRASPEV